MLGGRLVSQGLEKTREAHREGRRWAAPQEWTRVASEEDGGANKNKGAEVKLPCRGAEPRCMSLCML